MGEQLEPFYRAVVPLPASVASGREVCIQAYGDAESRECRRLEFAAEPLQQPPAQRASWAAGRADCPGCNERGLDAFLLNLDPRRWLDGLNSRMEVAAFGLETAILLAALLLVLLLLSKVVLPLLCCLKWCCTPGLARRRGKQRLIVDKF